MMATVRMLLAVLATLSAVLLASNASVAGETTTCFAQGRLGYCEQRVLEHVEFKSVVLQFVDPNETGLGESFSRLLWREVLESISDLSGAGVILAYDRADVLKQALSGRDYQDFLERDYHAAAQSIAQQLGVQMSIWGAVLQDGDQLYLQPFLTLHETAEQPWAALSVRNPAFPDLALSAVIGHARLNLASLQAPRSALFERSFVTRCALSAGCPKGIALRTNPSNDAPILKYVAVGENVRARDMRREWVELLTDGSEVGYVNLYHLEMFPRRVFFNSRTGVNLRQGPSTSAATARKVDLAGDYDVLDAARAARGEPWYLISVGGAEGWIAGRLVDRRSYFFPAVHLIAGLYRYGRGDYDQAAKEFDSFLAVSTEEDNVTRAVAEQFLAASRVAGRQGSEQGKEALAHLDNAVALTPFDPAAYTLRAVMRLGSGEGVRLAFVDLEHALDLDKSDVDAQSLLKALDALEREGGLWTLLAPSEDAGAAQEFFRKLRAQYPQP
jgi:tetratricopeptide (TPR) repeat protein